MEVSQLIGLKSQLRKSGYRQPVTANDEHALLAGCYYDPEEAHDPVDWAEKFCRLADGPRAGQRIELLDWHYNAITSMFGWKRRNGLRRFRKVYITLPKKNAKSTFCSVVSLWGLEMDGEEGAYIYLTAVDSDQTEQVFHPAAEMVRRSPDLSNRYIVLQSRHYIKFGDNAWIRAIASDSGGSEGLNAHMLIIDELHAWDNQEFYDSLEYASVARTQPLHIAITTRGSDPDSICGAHEEHFLKVASGEVIDISCLPIIYAADENDDLDSEETMLKANPGLGIILSLEQFKQDWENAKKGTPAQLANFKRRRFNLWQRGFSPYFDVAKWDTLACQINDEDLRSLPCYAALDLSRKSDLTSLGLCFLLDDGGYHVKTYHFTPEQNIKDLERKGQSLYRQWANAGHLIPCPGAIIRRAQVLEKLNELSEKYKIRSYPVGVDPWGGAQLMADLEDEDYEVFEFRQGYKSMSPPTKELSDAITAGAISHDGNPLLSWQMQNAVVMEDAHENIKVIKKSGTKKKLKHYKVDGVISMIMSIDGVMKHRGGSFADSERGVAVV